MSARRPREKEQRTHYADNGPVCGSSDALHSTYLVNGVTCPVCQRIIVRDTFLWGAKFLRRYRLK